MAGGPCRGGRLLGWLVGVLPLADVGQHGAQALVLDDGSLVDLAQLVEDPEGQVEALVADREPSVGVVDDCDPLPGERLGGLVRLQEDQRLVVVPCLGMR
jgi:hypothetical protein